ncbi:nucleotidyltransferase family protein [Clostridium sp. SY8519]|uniref:nucleotidyltransferase family protein n=1 Tax=Clostridium sp. (strain SY8519) TaxID=1042156 RepID=UPI0003163C57|nr:nucleotidyltransferase family protein [Clostridium sp. SY8519]
MMGGVILAAGMSSRMRIFKPLMEIAGKPMIFWSVQHMLDGGVQKVVVVTGHNHTELETYIRKQWVGKVMTAFHANYSNGEMFDSVKVGLQQLMGCSKVALSTGDLPAIDPRVYQVMLEEELPDRIEILIPGNGKKNCHPPVFTAYAVTEILKYDGTMGLKGFYDRHRDWIRYVRIEEPGCFMDLDYREDVAAVEELLSENNSHPAHRAE